MAFGLLLDPWISEIYDFKVLAPLQAEGPPPKKKMVTESFVNLNLIEYRRLHLKTSKHIKKDISVFLKQ